MKAVLFESKRSRADARASGLSARAAASLVLLWGLGCGTTPLDSVVAERVTGGGGSGDGGTLPGGTGGQTTAGTPASGSGGSDSGGSSDNGGVSGSGGGGAGGSSGAANCNAPAPGRYLVKDRVGDRCLQKGAPDTVFGAMIYNAVLDGDCSSLDAQWDFLEVVPNFYALLNAGIGNNLDVRAGATTDGTLIVLYSPHPSGNQLFAFLPTSSGYFALEPQNAPQKCIEAVGSAAKLYPCDTSNQAQDFVLARTDCP